MSPANTGSYGPSGLLPSEAFSARWRSRQKQKSRVRRPFGEWALGIAEPQTGKLDFARYPYQRELYEDTGDLPECVTTKGTQVGLTTKELRWVLWIAAEWMRTAMYVMPTEDVVKKFSAERVAPVIRHSDYLSGLLGPADPNNMGLRKIGRGFVHFVGSQVDTALDSVPAAALVLDEYDTLSQVNIPVAEERVGASPNPMIRRVGVPSLDGVGIDAQYQVSDMRRWMVRCEACNTRQQITMENFRWTELAAPSARALGRYEAWRVCRHCAKNGRERRIDVRDGQWVAEQPDRELRGYHVPRLIVPYADLGRIVAKSLSSDPVIQENHYHRDRGMPFEQAENRLSRAAIESCKREGVEQVESYIGYQPVTMGIDQASARAINVRISEHLGPREKRVLALLTVDDDDPDDPEARSAIRKLGMLMDVFDVNMAGIDHLPDGRLARALIRAYPGRVIMAALSANLKRPMTEVPRIEDPEQIVTVNRTVFIDATLDLFRWQRNLLPRRPQPVHDTPLGRTYDPEEYETHLRALVRERVQKPDGTWVFRYDNKGDADWAFAELFDVIATEVMHLRMVVGSVEDGLLREQEVEPDVPTANFNDWDGRPWDEEYRPGGESPEPWGGEDEYRPFG